MVSQGPWSSSQIGPADQHCEHHSQEPQSDVMGCRFFLACLLLQRMPPQKDKYRKGCGSPVFICFCFFDGGKPAEKYKWVSTLKCTNYGWFAILLSEGVVYWSYKFQPGANLHEISESWHIE